MYDRETPLTQGVERELGRFSYLDPLEPALGRECPFCGAESSEAEQLSCPECGQGLCPHCADDRRWHCCDELI